jgi:hypothetical protein
MQIPHCSSWFHGTSPLNNKNHGICFVSLLPSVATCLQSVFVITATTYQPSIQFTSLEVSLLPLPFMHSLHPAMGVAGGGTLSQVFGEDMVRDESE